MPDSSAGAVRMISAKAAQADAAVSAPWNRNW